MHRARDSRGRFIARAKSSIFTTLATSRHRQDTPPSSLTHTPNLRITGIQGAAELGDSSTLSTKSDLGEEPFFTSTRKHIVITEVESPEAEEGETLSHSPLIEEPEDSEETIMTEEVVDGFGGGGRGIGRGGGNNGRGRGNNGGNRDGDNSFGFPIADEETHATMKNILPSVLPNFYGLQREDPETFLFQFEVLC